MARLTENDKKLIVADYHTGKFSQRDLAKRFNVSLGTISNLTKDIEPQNEHLVNAQLSVLSAKAELPNEQMNAVLNTAQELSLNKGLCFGVTQKALRIADKLLDQTDTTMNDVKLAVELADRASLTLKVNERHAPKVELTQTNQTVTPTQINIIRDI